MLSWLLASLVLPLGACGGGGTAELPSAPHAAISLSVPADTASAGRAVAQSATPVQLLLDVPTRVDAVMAALGSGAWLSGSVAAGLQGEGWMEYILDAPAAEDFSLHLLYAHGSDNSVPLVVRVNEGPAQSVLLAPSGGMGHFLEAPALALSLAAGRNLLRLQAAGASAAGAAPTGAAGPAISAVVVQRMQPLLAPISSIDASFDASANAVVAPATSGLELGLADGVGTNTPLPATVSDWPSLPSGPVAMAPAGLAAVAAASTPGLSIDSAMLAASNLLAASTAATPSTAAPNAPNPPNASVEPAPATAPGAATPAGPTHTAPAVPTAWANPRASARIFISGHSLTDNPLGEQLVAIANNLGGAQAARYNQQIVIGSPIRFRTDRNANWAGYSRGKNREGSGMNVINELRSPATLGGDRYDTLVIAENHRSLEMLQWESSVRNLRHFHDRFLAGNAGTGRSLFYETWFDINDKTNPAAWIAHERAQSRAWQCVVTRVNTALAAEGRVDRITPLPAGAALVDLIERATQGQVPGVTRSSTAATVNALLADNVHLTSLGVHYMALVSYAAIFQRPPTSSVVPPGVSSEAAASLQEAAWRFVANFYSQYREPTLEACRTEVVENFCSTYWTYRGQPGNVAGCRRVFGSSGADNPLYFDATTNASYWYPAP